MSADPKRTRRLILVDDNIRDIGGHYFELATLLLTGAQRMGYQPVLATNANFDQQQAVDPTWKLHPVFHTRRLVRWSIGVDGDSNFQRDESGRTVGGNAFDRLWSIKSDLLVPPAKRPKKMLGQWASDLCDLFAATKPTPGDSLLVNTGDDFAMLALATAMKRAELAPMRIDVIFHFALYESQQPDRNQRLNEIGRQLRASLASLAPHRVHLHATTDALAAQLRETDCGAHIGSIPYPTRAREIVSGSTSEPLKAVLAGLPRAEKGRGAIADLLSGVEKSLIKEGRFRMSMQMPEDRWQAMVPTSLHRAYQNALAGNSPSCLEIMTSNLSTEGYHQWLDTADLGLFLYDSDRYVARCSGVLLEMMVRGVPVIVPDRCWLAQQVRMAGGHRSIGFIYQDRGEIPELMRQFARLRGKIQARSTEYANTIAKRHDGANSLVKMGIQPVATKRQAA